MPDQRKHKVVQTELELADYEMLLNLAKSKNMSLKDATREALRYWAASVADLSKDPLFKLKPTEFKVKIKSNEIDAFLYKKMKR